MYRERQRYEDLSKYITSSTEVSQATSNYFQSHTEVVKCRAETDLKELCGVYSVTFS